jgi:hypothetical protein
MYIGEEGDGGGEREKREMGEEGDVGVRGR